MTGLSAYFDTSPFIYLVEGHPQFERVVAQFIQQGVTDGILFNTSVLTAMEFGVKPLQLGRPDLLRKFDELLVELNFSIPSNNRRNSFRRSPATGFFPFSKITGRSAPELRASAGMSVIFDQ